MLYKDKLSNNEVVLRDIDEITYMAMAKIAFDINVERDAKKAALSREILNKEITDSIIKKMSSSRDELANLEIATDWSEVYKQALSGSGWKIIDVATAGYLPKDDKSGFCAILFVNDYTEQAVIAFRGSQDIKKHYKDDWKDDFIYHLLNEASAQMYHAVGYTSYCMKKYPSYGFSATGHSLGGGLAITASVIYNIDASPFDSSATLDVCYYRNLVAQFSGTDKWRYDDNVCEGDIAIGLWDTDKNYDAYKNIFDYDNASGIEYIFGAHDLAAITTKNSYGAYCLTNKVREHYYDANATYSRVANTHFPANTIDKGSLMLGTSLKNKIYGRDALIPYTEVIYSGDGDDAIYARGGDDYLHGNTGNDQLDGGSGDDHYFYAIGDGTDKIYDESGSDNLYILGVYAYGDITFDSESDNSFILVKYKGTKIISISKNRHLWSSFKATVIKKGEEEGKSTDLRVWNGWKSTKNIKLACPVDMKVYDSAGNCVLTITNESEEATYTEYGQFYVFYNEESGEYEKEAILFDDSYTVRAVGTGEGTMNFLTTIQTGEEDKSSVSYAANDIAVSENTIFEVIDNRTEEEHVPNQESIELVRYVDAISDNSISNNSMMKQSAAADTKLGKSESVSADGVSTNRVLSENSISKNSISENSISENSSSENIVEVLVETDNIQFEKVDLTVEEQVPVEKIVVAGSVNEINKGDTTQLTASIVPELATNKSVTWEAADPYIAEVDSTTGVVSGNHLGETQIIAYSEEGTCGTYTIKVKGKIEAPSASDESGYIRKNDTVALCSSLEGSLIYYTVDGSNPTSKSILYEGPIEITQDCEIKTIAVKEGYTTSDVATYGYEVASVELELPQDTYIMQVGTEQTLIPVTLPTTCTLDDITWSSDNAGVATVDENGAITAVAVGDAIITVTGKDYSDYEVARICTIFVVDNSVYTVRFDANGGSFAENEINEKQVINTETYRSLPNVKRADYTFAGWYTDSKAGTAIEADTIVNLENDITLFARWQKNDADEILLNDTKLLMATGDTKQLVVRVVPDCVSPIYKVADETIATISATGLITAKAEGTTVVKVSVGNTYVRCRLDVVNSDEKSEETTLVMSLVKNVLEKTDKTNLGIKYKDTIVSLKDINMTFTTDLAGESLLNVEDNQITGKAIVKGTDGKEIFSILNGTITAIGESMTKQVYIQATYTKEGEEAEKATCLLTVKVPAQQIRIKREAVQNLTVGDTLDLSEDLTVLPINADGVSANALTWASMNRSVATVDALGVVQAKQAGRTVISVTTKSGQTDRVTVAVDKPATPDFTILTAATLYSNGVDEETTEGVCNQKTLQLQSTPPGRCQPSLEEFQ